MRVKTGVRQRRGRGVLNVLVIDLRCGGYSEREQDEDDPNWQDGTHDFAANGSAAVAALKDGAQALANESPAKAAGKIILRDGSAHGWDMLCAPDANAEVIAFLKGNT
jgi:hypothetical protein